MESSSIAMIEKENISEIQKKKKKKKKILIFFKNIF